MRRGITPLIAGIILIGIVVATGAMLSGWITQMVSRTSGGVSVCSLETSYTIDRADYSIGTGILSIRITNTGETKLYGFGAKLINSTETLEFTPSSPEISSSPVISIDSKLEKGRSFYLNIDLSGYPGMGISIQRITVVNEECPDTSAATESVTMS